MEEENKGKQVKNVKLVNPITRNQLATAQEAACHVVYDVREADN